MRIEETTLNGIPIKTMITEESDLSTQQQKDTWLEVCNGCEYFSNNQCLQCGCIVETIMMLTTAKCPINKW
jgi:hypothetical protein